MSRRILGTVTAIALILGAIVITQVSAFAGKPAGACKLDGTANFSAPVTTSSQAVSYTFDGTVKKCVANNSPVKSGTITANGSGSVSCAKSKTSGSATINWDDGETSALDFTATGVASGVLVQGTISSGAFAGAAANAVLSFTTTSPQSCASGGLSSLGFTGAAELR